MDVKVSCFYLSEPYLTYFVQDIDNLDYKEMTLGYKTQTISLAQ